MRLENLKVKNFKTIRSLELKNFTPLTVFIGVNGVGKSNLLDVFNFLFDCFTQGAITAFEQRGGFAAVYTQGGNSPLELEIKYREEKDAPLITYHVTFSASGDRAVVEKEWLQWRPRSRGLPVRFLDFQQGKGWAIPGEKPVLPTEAVEESLVTPHLLAAPLLGTLQKHPRLTALTQYIQSWKITSDMPLDKTSFGLVGIEGIEKGIYPRQLVELAEQYRTLSSSTQFFLTTHSPFFVDGLKPEEVWLLTLDALGYTEANRLSEQPMIQALLKRQLELSSLWGVNYFWCASCTKIRLTIREFIFLFSMSIGSFLKGTRSTTFKVALLMLAAEAEGIAIKNATGTQYENLIADLVQMVGDEIQLNINATEAGNDWLFSIIRNAAQTQNINLTLPASLPPETRQLQLTSLGELVYAAQTAGALSDLNPGQLLSVTGTTLNVDYATQTAIATPADTDLFVIYNGTAYRKVTWSDLKSELTLLFGAGLVYQGNFNPLTSTPALANGVGDTGDFYIATTSGSYNFGAGSVTVTQGDWIIYASDGTYRVNGAVTAGTTDQITNVAVGVNGGGGSLTDALTWLLAQINASSPKILHTILNFNSASEITLGDLPVGAYVTRIDSIPITPFTGAPVFSVGTNAIPNKYQPASGVDSANLLDTEPYQNNPHLPQPTVGVETVKVFYTANGATQGSFAIKLHYGVQA